MSFHFSRVSHGILKAFSRSWPLAILLGCCPGCDPRENGSNTAQIEAESPAWVTNRVRWTVGSEESCFGYEVHRSTSRDGPFERISASPVAGHGTSDQVRAYVYEDTRAEAGKTYFYKIEEIKMDNRRRSFPNVFEVAPPPKAENAASSIE